MELEIWKDIPGWEGFYQVSTLGRIKSLPRPIWNGQNIFYRKEKVLKNQLTKSGYVLVGLHREGGIRSYTIHLLMAIAFLNHKPNGTTLVVDHINNIKSDNRLSNLQILTHRENITKSIKGRYSKYVGVSYFPKDKKWRSAIRIGGITKYLGRFDTEEAASEAYQKELKAIQ
jgi:hypothetical protein